MSIDKIVKVCIGVVFCIGALTWAIASIPRTAPSKSFQIKSITSVKTPDEGGQADTDAVNRAQRHVMRGVNYHSRGNYSNAIREFKSALSIYDQVLLPNDLRIAIAANLLGRSYYNERRYQLAEDQFYRAWQIDQANKINPDLESAQVLADLSAAYRENRKFDLARSAATRALQLRMHIKGPKDGRVVRSLMGLYRLEAMTYNFDAAKANLDAADRWLTKTRTHTPEVDIEISLARRDLATLFVRKTGIYASPSDAIAIRTSQAKALLIQLAVVVSLIAAFFAVTIGPNLNVMPNWVRRLHNFFLVPGTMLAILCALAVGKFFNTYVSSVYFPLYAFDSAEFDALFVIPQLVHSLAAVTTLPCLLISYAYIRTTYDIPSLNLPKNRFRSWHKFHDPYAAGSEFKQQFSLPKNRWFAAMEFFALLTNRTFIVFITPDMLCGAKVRGWVAIDISKYIDDSDPFEWINTKEAARYVNVDPTSEAFLKMNPNNFQIRWEDISHFEHKEYKWGMGFLYYSGRILIHLTNGTTREMILLGKQNPYALLVELEERDIAARARQAAKP